jgi:DNA-binding NtrC family response regulator
MGSKVIPSLAKGAIDQLMAYHWPGNVRELENVVERALILSRGESINVKEFRSNMDFYTGTNRQADCETLMLDEIISRHIRRVLEMCNGRVEGKLGTADLLAVQPSTLRKKMRKLGICFGRKAQKGGLANV